VEETVTEDITLKVYRGDATSGKEETYKVPAVEGMVVLDAIHWIQGHTDSTLACRWNCKAAKCGSCSAEVNGRPRLMCKTRVDEFKGQPIKVHPMKAFPLIKDLVTDVSYNYKVAKTIPAFAPKEKAPFSMQQIDVDRVQEFRKCIECFLCQDVCHVLRDHKANYAGPRFMVKVAALEMHPKDGASRTTFLKDRAHIGMCNITKCCEELCPEDIHITDNAIIPLKERVVNDHYDPVLGLIRKIAGKTKPQAVGPSDE
jgi:succinate dehydrogenase / fumarate reductase iron-sulfur subunit